MSVLVPTKVILHCSATRDDDSLSWEAIRRYHVDTLGWDDIGYHFCIELYNGQLVYKRGRHPSVKGAHCKAAGRNSDSLGVCVVGNYDEVPPNDDRMDATVCFLANLCFVFNIPADQVYGHNEFEPMKTCPGKKWNMDLTRAEVEHALKEFEGWDV
jgi:hypothetical protein